MWHANISSEPKQQKRQQQQQQKWRMKENLINKNRIYQKRVSPDHNY